MSDLREKRVELILQQMEELPTLPTVAVRVLEATGRDDTSAADVVHLIESDPSLTTRILQLVHRSDLGVRGEVNSVERAVVLLGFEAVRSAVLAVSVFETFAPSGESEGPFSRDEFWKHCIAVACCAESLATQLQAALGRDAGFEPSEAFVCGLLHDLGKVALDAMLPKSFGKVVEAADMLRGNIADLERTIIGLDHMVVGKRLAERWQLPADVRQCIWLHGQLPQALPSTVRNPRLVNLITLADLLARQQHLGYSGNYTYTVTRAALAEAIGLSDGAIDRVLQHLLQHIEPRARALGLGQASSGELYQHALAQANRELGRVSSQLASRNRKLAIRARFFDALSHFQSELRPDAPPSVVLQAIGQTAAATLDAAAVAVFSLPPGRDYAEATVLDREGHVLGNTIVDLTGQTLGSPLALGDTPPPLRPLARPTMAPQADGPVQPAGQDLEWFINTVSPRLPHEKRWWIALASDGQCIGGVVWGGPEGEAQRLSPQASELKALAGGWSLALRTTQIREEARTLSEQLAEANRRLQEAQNELLRSRTVMTVGEMAAGAAHEMNNPLAVISGRSQLLAQELLDARQKASATLIHEQADRLSQIISELMDFAKPTAPAPEAASLPQIVAQALEAAKKRTEPADRAIEVELGEVPALRVDAAQVTGALIEVLDNALQATDPKRGAIRLHAAFDPYSRRVVLTVTDNGSGIDEANLKRVFDPFFSAKPAGRRRGMGLPKALRWIEMNGGSLRLESRVNDGTSAILLLPSDPAPAPAGEALRRQQA